MEIPVYIDEEKVGVMTIQRRGTGALLDLRMADVGRVVRLTLYGETAFYLGVPVPEGDGLRLTKRLNAGEAARLPRDPAYAAERRRSAPPAAGPERKPPRRVLWLGGRPYYF